jgi:hypothetical protein
MFTDIAVKLKKEGEIKQVERSNLCSNRISFNSAYCRVINYFNFYRYKLKSEILLRPKKN